MGVGYQLILVNGKRMTEYSASSGAASTGVSIGSIPAAAVARIEVLNAGASAIYGSDAVAGVVNIVTKEGWEGNNLRLRGGTTSVSYTHLDVYKRQARHHGGAEPDHARHPHRAGAPPGHAAGPYPGRAQDRDGRRRDQ